jgi:hypothetical protein
VAVPTERQFASAPLRINNAILGLLRTGAAYVLNYQIITSEGATIASTVTHLLPVVAKSSASSYSASMSLFWSRQG